jgi:azobenzene reductase
MSYVIISGSPRADSQTHRTAEYIFSQIAKKFPESSVALVDLHGAPLPMYDDTISDNSEVASLWNPISEKLTECTAAVFITPEWNGMAAPALKNMLLYLGKELAHKPVLLVSVVAGMTNGAYPIAELRMSSYKNPHICYIPNHVIVRNAGSCFIGDEPSDENKSDTVARSRIARSLEILGAYADALKTMRETLDNDWNEFPNGM